MKRIIKTLCMTLLMLNAQNAAAQIGYQVAVMDPDTGEPKANQSVNVSIALEDNSGKSLATLNKTMQTNEFGVIAVELGNSTTFNDMDWSKLPLWVSATVDGVNLGKTQVLSVPVAEYARHTGSLTKELLTSKSWSGYYDYFNRSYTFDNNQTFFMHATSKYDNYSAKGKYFIEGNHIILTYDYGSYYDNDGEYAEIIFYSKGLNCLLMGNYILK